MELSFWQKQNASFKQKCIYKIGSKSGFFSEYNNMLLALHYCAVKGVQFILCSKWANFGTGKGWDEYFLPFCEERNFPLDYYYFNDRLRYHPVRKKEKYKGWAMNVCLGWFYSLRAKLLNIRYFTWNAYDCYRVQSLTEKFSFKGVDVEGILVENCRILNEMIWRYNEETLHEINALIPVTKEPYVSIHVRRGDKDTEVAHTSLKKYMFLLAEQTTLRTCFVATDDYRVYQQLCEEYPEWNFFTITRTEETGFSEYAYNGRRAEQKRGEMIELFATIEIMAKSELFVGTMSSNIGMYMYWRMPEGMCLGVDYNEWRIW